MPEQPKPPAQKAQPRNALLESAPWRPAPYTQADVTALQRLARGEAGSNEQKRALDYVMRVLCGIDDWAYRPGSQEGERDTTLALGRQFVGHQISKMLRIDPTKLK